MDEERNINISNELPDNKETTPAFYFRNLDDETIQILMEDRIATGG